MSKDEIKGIMFCVIGAVFLIFNKPLGEMFRQWQIMIWKKDYGCPAFQWPLLLIGAGALILGLLGLLGWLEP